MMSFFNFIYNRYDKIQEPWRFFAFFIPMMFLVIGVHSGILWLAILSGCIAGLFMITRVIYLSDDPFWINTISRLVKKTIANKRELKKIKSILASKTM